MADGDDDPARAEEYTYTRMWAHILQKGFQLGSAVGTGVVLPVMLYRTGGFAMPAAEALNRALSAAGMSTAGGIAFASARPLNLGT
jgi:pyridoxal biosynthesis lyase PdxS